MVEDDDRFRGLLTKFLRRKGYFVQDAANGTAALSLIERSTFDLLITDYQLGERIDGFDVLARFERVRPRTGKIVISGHPDAKSRCDSVGAVHLSKPFSFDDLLTKIESTLPKYKPSLVNVTDLAELIKRARIQRVACRFAKERANRQRMLCDVTLNSNRHLQASADNLKIRIEKFQRSLSF